MPYGKSKKTPTMAKATYGAKGMMVTPRKKMAMKKKAVKKPMKKGY